MVHRTARIGLRLTRAQRQRCFGLLRSAGDVWACVLEINTWRRRHDARPVAGFHELCRLLAESGPGTFGELDSTGARSVLRRYSDAWFSAAARRKAGALEVRFPRRRRVLMPVRWYHGKFALTGRRLRLPTARGCPPLLLRLDRLVPYPAETVRSVTLLFDDGRLWIDVAAELPVTVYPEGANPRPGSSCRGRSGDHPPVRRGRPRQRRSVGVRAGDPSRAPAAPGRHQRPSPRHRPPRPQQRPTRVTAVASGPPAGSAGRRPAPAAGPAGAARGRENSGQLGRQAADRDADRRRPPRRAQPQRWAGAQPAGAAVADRPHPATPARQSRPRRYPGAPGRRTRHLLNLPRLPAKDSQAGRSEPVLQALRVRRAP